MAMRPPRSTASAASKLPEAPKPPQYLSLSKAVKPFTLFPLFLGAVIPRSIKKGAGTITIPDFAACYDAEAPAVLIGPLSALDRTDYAQRNKNRSIESAIRKVALTISAALSIQNAVTVLKHFRNSREEELLQEDPAMPPHERQLRIIEEFREKHLAHYMALQMVDHETGCYIVDGYDEPVELLTEMIDLLAFVATRYGVIKAVDTELYIKDPNNVKAYVLESVDEAWFKASASIQLNDLMTPRESGEPLWQTIFKITNLLQLDVEEDRADAADKEDGDETKKQEGEGPIPF